MPARLLALAEGPNLLLDKPILLVGRHPECDIQIESRKISRRHCCIAQVNDYLVVRDLESTNGVLINGVRQAEGRLNEGDELTIGNHRYRLTWHEEQEPAPPRSRGLLPNVPAKQMPISSDGLVSVDVPVPLKEPMQGTDQAPDRLVAKLPKKKNLVGPGPDFVDFVPDLPEEPEPEGKRRTKFDPLDEEDEEPS